MSKSNWGTDEPGCFGSLICCSRDSEACQACKVQTRCADTCSQSATIISTTVSVSSSVNKLPKMSSAYLSQLIDLTKVSRKAQPLARRLNQKGVSIPAVIAERRTTGVDTGLDFAILHLNEAGTTVNKLTGSFADQYTLSIRTAENRIGRALNILEASGIIKRDKNRVYYEHHWR